MPRIISYFIPQYAPIWAYYVTPPDYNMVGTFYMLRLYSSIIGHNVNALMISTSFFIIDVYIISMNFYTFS